MIAEQKPERLLPERIKEYCGSATAANANPTAVDTAGDLIKALDTLLLDRAREQHRVALARLNELTLALGKGKT